MTAPSVETTTADRLNDSPRIARAIDAIIEELQGAQSSIVSARPPVRELEVDYEAALQRLGETRGRPAFYPYLGSGVGRGPLVELADGSVKWDMISGIGVHMFGHSDPDLAATALRAALSRHGHAGQPPVQRGRRGVQRAAAVRSRRGPAVCTTASSRTPERWRTSRRSRCACRSGRAKRCAFSRSPTASWDARRPWRRSATAPGRDRICR